jgi:cyclase
MAGPVDNWIRACDHILALDVDLVVPGHGPITDKGGVKWLRDYFVFIRDETRRCWDAGLSEADATAEISLDAFRGWREAERIVLNVSARHPALGIAASRPLPR